MSKKEIRVTVGDVVKEYPAGTTYETLAKDFQKDCDARIVLASTGGKLRELNKKINDEDYNRHLDMIAENNPGKLLEIFEEASDKVLSNAERKLLFDAISYEIISYI